VALVGEGAVATVAADTPNVAAMVFADSLGETEIYRGSRAEVSGALSASHPR
jgi:hypothetical protein